MSRNPHTPLLESRTALVVFLILASLLAARVVPLPKVEGFFQTGQSAETVIGQRDFLSQTQGLGPASFNHPFRPSFDASGNLWVTDENNRRVLEFKAPLESGESASLVIGQPGFDSNSSQFSRSSLSTPVGIAFDSTGDLWVSDFLNNRTLEFTPPFANGMNASLELGQAAGANRFTSNIASNGPAGLHSPIALAFDRSGNLWIIDRLNNRVLEFKPPFVDGESASAVIGQPDFTSTVAAASQNGLAAPESLAFDSMGNLWVVDQANNRVLEYSASSLSANGPPAELEIGHPQGPDMFSSRSSGTSQSQLNAPVGIAFDSSGDLWLSDRVNNRVLGFVPPFSNGMNASFEIGQPTGANQYTSASSGVSQSSIHNPLGLVVDRLGNLWLADQLNNRVLEFSGMANATSSASATSSPASSFTTTIQSGPVDSVPLVLTTLVVAFIGLATLAYTIIRIRARRN